MIDIYPAWWLWLGLLLIWQMCWCVLFNKWKLSLICPIKVPGLHVTCSLLVLLRSQLTSNVHYTLLLCWFAFCWKQPENNCKIKPNFTFARKNPNLEKCSNTRIKIGRTLLLKIETNSQQFFLSKLRLQQIGNLVNHWFHIWILDLTIDDVLKTCSGSSQP